MLGRVEVKQDVVGGDHQRPFALGAREALAARKLGDALVAVDERPDLGARVVMIELTF